MPNWCNNSLELQHEDPEMIERVAKAIEADRFFSEFAPCPKELTETTSGFFGNEGYQAELQKFTEELNVRYFGYKDWYDWNNANWGTKWEACQPTFHKDSDKFLHITFDSAWSPPFAFYEKLCDLGFSVEAMYYEGGMGFCGTWEDGIEDYYNIEGDSKWVRKHIPSAIDDAFCISEGMAEWEEEEEEA
jgi:hypothetical protein